MLCAKNKCMCAKRAPAKSGCGKLRCDERFTHAFTACSCVFKETTLVWANQRNYFENATTCSKRMRKTIVATQHKSGNAPTNFNRIRCLPKQFGDLSKAWEFAWWQHDGRDGVVDVVEAPLVVALLHDVLTKVDTDLFTLNLKYDCIKLT